MVLGHPSTSHSQGATGITSSKDNVTGLATMEGKSGKGATGAVGKGSGAVDHAGRAVEVLEELWLGLTQDPTPSPEENKAKRSGAAEVGVVGWWITRSGRWR